MANKELTRFIHSISVPALVVDFEYKIVDINQGFTDLFGHTPETSIGKPVENYTINKRLNLHIDGLTKLIEGKINQYNLNRPYLTAHTNQIIDVNITVSILTCPLTEKRYLLSLMNHVNVLADASESVAKEVSDFTNTALSIIPDHIYIFDIVNREVLYENKSLLKYLGYDFADLNGKKQAIFLLEKMDRDSIVRGKERVVTNKRYVSKDADNKFVEGEYRIQCKDGSYKWFYERISIIKKKEDAPEWSFCILKDITKEKEKEAINLAQQNLINKVNSTVSDFISVYNPNDYKQYYTNLEDGNTFLGYTNDELTKGAVSLLRDDFKENAIRRIEFFKTKNFDAVHENNVCYIDKQGKERWVRVRIKVFEKDEHGVPTKILFVATEISNMVEAQNELKQKNKELRNYISKNKELEQFAYIISHDLKEPLRSIGNFSSMLGMSLKSKQNIDYLNRIKDSSERMYKLINRLLEYSRIETQGREFNKVDIGSICQAVVKDLNEAIVSAKAKVSINFSDVFVYGDDVQIRQLFQNLISNSLKFISKEQPQISINAAVDKQIVTVSVKDNGIGIVEDNVDIFNIFQRKHHQNAFPGEGIGLSICKRIIDRHGGEIWYTSAVGQGTHFYFTLPAFTG